MKHRLMINSSPQHLTTAQPNLPNCPRRRRGEEERARITAISPAKTRDCPGLLSGDRKMKWVAYWTNNRKSETGMPSSLQRSVFTTTSLIMLWT